MLRSSVAKLLLALIGGLIVVLLLMSGTLLRLAWSRFVDAREVVVLARADRVLFDAAVGIRAQIARVQTGLMTMEAPQAIVEVSRADAERAYRSVRRVLEEIIIPGRPTALRDVADAWAAAEYQRSLVDEQIRTPRALRDIRLMRPWRDAVLRTVGALNDASVAIGNVIRLKEPIVAELAHVRGQASAIRDAYGEQCSVLGSFVVTGVNPDIETSSEWNMKVGAYRSRWEELDAYLQRPAADQRVLEATRAAHKLTEDTQRAINVVVWTLGESGKEVLSGEEWAALCDTPFSSIVGIGQLALDEAIDYADDSRRSAAATLGAVLMGTLISLGSALYAAWILRERFSRPMRSVLGTIDELSRRNFSATVDYAHRCDELGAIARALKLLQTIMRRNAELEEESLREKQREHEARLAAESANRAKSVFLANMSHELRTPLNAILGFSQLMDRDAALPAGPKEYVSIIRASGEHLLGLIDDVLDMAKIEAGKQVLAEANADLHRLIDDTANLMCQRAEAKGLRFVLERGADVPRYILGDSPKLRQILINLLGNAVKFTDTGGVDFDVSRLRTEPGDGGVRHWLRFEIADSGCGISADEFDRVFEPFVQGKGGHSGGTGLGLAITQQFVRLMGGDVRIASRIGEGSVFTVDLPFKEGMPFAKETALPRVLGLQPGQGEFRVLVVDDSTPSRVLLLKLLQTVGFGVRAAADGREAVAVAEVWRPHFIWMDLRMPVMDGFDATRAIKSQDWGKDIVVVALTSSIALEDARDVLSAGCAEVQRKPFREQDIFDIMARRLNVRYVTAPGRESAIAADMGQENLDKLPGQLARLDADRRNALRMALETGELAAIAQAIDDVSKVQPDLDAVLHRMAREFRFHRILDAIAMATADPCAGR